MRVTANTFPNALVQRLNQLATREYRLQNQAATGQRLQLPEDDPAAVRRVLDLQTSAQSLQQFQRNINRAQEISQASFDSIRSLKKISDRAAEIATLADSLRSPEELATYAEELNQLLEQAAQAGNAKNRGDFLFAGTRVQAPAFEVVRGADGRISGVTFQGNTAATPIEIAPGVEIVPHLPGANSSGAGAYGLTNDARTGADFFSHLISLRDHLTQGTPADLEADRTGLAQDEEHLLLQLGSNGALQSRLESTAALLTKQGASVDSLISKETDADLAQTLVRLRESETAYQAALQTGASLISRSLLDFLR